MIKRHLVTALLAGLFLSASLPALASSFYGMVIHVSIYNVTVKNHDQIKVFQIRPQTRGDKPIQAQDWVVVNYANDNGVEWATRVKVVKRFVP